MCHVLPVHTYCRPLRAGQSQLAAYHVACLPAGAIQVTATTTAAVMGNNNQPTPTPTPPFVLPASRFGSLL